MNHNKHNGWTNYETWAVSLWMANEEGRSRHYDRMAQEAWDAAVSDETRELNATYELSETIKEEHEEAAENRIGRDVDVFSDLLAAALTKVNWVEIAEHLIAGVDKTDDEPAATEGVPSDENT